MCLQVIYSGGMDVDILPKGASKGDGLKFLLREVRFSRFYPSSCCSMCFTSVRHAFADLQSPLLNGLHMGVEGGLVISPGSC